VGRFPKREIEEPVELSGQGEDPVRILTCGSGEGSAPEKGFHIQREVSTPHCVLTKKEKNRCKDDFRG
jgi:hypothetical protein